MIGEKHHAEMRDIKPFKILSKVKIGEGGNGTVYKIEVLSDGRTERFAMKVYAGSASKQRAGEAVRMHTTLEKAGAKTLPTYRLLEDGSHQIVMTLHDPDEVFVVDGKPTYKGLEPIEPASENKTDNIATFEKLLEQFFKQAILAAKVGVEFKLDDVFRFTIDKKDKSQVDFWIEDFDRVDLHRNELDDEARENILKQNLDICETTMTFFVNTRVRGEMKEKYLTEVKSAYNALLNADKTKLLMGYNL